MAKGDVTLRFDANTAEFIQRVMAARSALDETAKKARETGEAVKKAGDHADDFGRKIAHGVKELAGLLAIPTTVMGGLELTMQAVERRLALAEARAKALAVRSATWDSAMFALGTTGQSKDIRGQLEELTKSKYSGVKFDAKDVESMFAQVVTSVGPRATPNQFIAATRTALGASGAGANVQQAVQAGSAMAVIQALMPGIGEDEADELARFMQLNAPDVLQNEKILGTIATSKDKMGTARFFASGYQNFQGAKRIKPLSDWVEAHPGMDYEKILANPSMLPPAERSVLEAIRVGASGLRGAGSREEASRAAIVGGDARRDAYVISRNVDATGDDILEANASQDTINRKIAERASQIYRLEHPMMPVPEAAFSLPAVTPRQFPMTGRGGPMPDPALSDLNQARLRATREVQEQLDELRGIRAAVENMSRNSGGGPMLNNNKEGQK